MKNSKFKYTKIRSNNIFSHIEDILFKIKSKLSKSNSIQRIRTTYVHSTRYTSNDKKNNIFLSIIKKFALAVVSLSLFMILANFLIINMRHTSNAAILPEDKMPSNAAYSKILDEKSPEQVSYNTSSISEVPTVTSAVTLENATDIFYNSITSDNTLVGDGTIGMKYDEYIIEEGDNLTTISRKIGANLDTLVSVNKITNANRLRPGQKIVVPNRNGLLYTIKKDESIEEIIQTKPTILRGEDANIINREQVNVYNRKLQEDQVKIVQVNKVKKHVKFVPVPIELLADRSSEKDDQKNIEVCDARLEKINEILNDLKIGAKIVSYQIGPSVTRYDLQTERGVSINGFEKYISDISIRLGGLEARFVPLIQGKTTSGIEIANANRSLVNFKDVFTHLPQKKPGQFYIPFGKNISGDYIHADLAEFPHMLVCGTTGSGKSIFMHSVILSLIMRSSIEELRLIMIDPKKVEFTKYRDSPHLLCPVISEPTEASATLLRLADEMEERFDLFQEYDVSNIKQYNEYARENNLEPMYYIVLVVDEFADLIETCKTISQPIQRLGAKARAAGIHMIIATQRPSTDIITGSIKANLAIRVALMTSSVTDSVVALGEGGAEKLLGNGDMLVSCPLISKQEKVRVQGCFVDNNEIIRAVRFIKEKYPLDYNPKFLNLLEKTRLNTEDFGVIHPSNNEDERYEEIKRYIMENKENCSISMIQREFSFGYTRSMKIFKILG